MAALGGAEYNMAMISFSGLPQDQPGLRGRVIAGHIAPREGEIMQEGRPFLPVLKRRATYQRADFEPAGQPGWLVFNEAWHLDWTAREGAADRILPRGRPSSAWIPKNGASGNPPTGAES